MSLRAGRRAGRRHHFRQRGQRNAMHSFGRQHLVIDGDAAVRLLEALAQAFPILLREVQASAQLCHLLVRRRELALEFTHAPIRVNELVLQPLQAELRVLEVPGRGILLSLVVALTGPKRQLADLFQQAGVGSLHSGVQPRLAALNVCRAVVVPAVVARVSFVARRKFHDGRPVLVNQRGELADSLGHVRDFLERVLGPNSFLGHLFQGRLQVVAPNGQVPRVGVGVRGQLLQRVNGSIDVFGARLQRRDHFADGFQVLRIRSDPVFHFVQQGRVVH
mmetsp:Transcript_69150/g.192496  ORF Transcript_69150/g.192496 Transcript_69150/m.192496 type:complete len:277 (-) Transcript_69150:524-1354(-)